MNNSWVSVVRFRCQETRRPTSDVEVVTPFVRDFNPSLALRYPTAIASKGSMILSGSTIVHLPHFQQFRQFCWNQSIVCIHCNFSTFDSFLIFAILASFNLFLTVSSISIVSTANLTSLGFFWFLWIPCPLSLREVQFARSLRKIPQLSISQEFSVNMSAGFDSDATFTSRKCFAATRSCSHSILVCMWRVLLPVPLREATAFALEESVCSESCSFRFQSANKLCKPNFEHPPFVSAQYTLSALLRPITFCTVKLCLNKCCPLTITPVVLRRVTVSPGQSLSMCTSKCALLGSCAGYCCAFLGTPFRYLATRFNCIMWPTLGFDIPRARHLIVSEMSARSCAQYAQRMILLRYNVACSPSRIGLFSIASASVALSFTLGVLTILPWVSPRSSSNRWTCFWSASISINSSLITLTNLCNTSNSLSRCFAAPIMPILLVSNFSCNIFPKISIWSSAAAITKSSPWQNPLTSSDLYNAGLLAPSSKPLLRRSSPHRFCHALLASSVPYIVLLSFATRPGRCKSAGGSTWTSRSLTVKVRSWYVEHCKHQNSSTFVHSFCDHVADQCLQALYW